MTDLPPHHPLSSHPLSRRPLDRRSLLRAGAIGTGLIAATAFAGGRASGLVRSDRPVLTHGVQSGDVDRHSAMVWTRADRPSR
ncbi:hypothetical protein ACZ91_45935 [Streptomyces regensis]|nr:hypothetical protein ACZ91_45935 [Streptomyces regensis]